MARCSEPLEVMREQSLRENQSSIFSMPLTSSEKQTVGSVLERERRRGQRKEDRKERWGFGPVHPLSLPAASLLGSSKIAFLCPCQCLSCSCTEGPQLGTEFRRDLGRGKAGG